MTTWLLAALCCPAAWTQTMNDTHQLTALWAKYDAAHKADKPQKEAELLAQIKEEAEARHLPVDFYDAAGAYVNTVLRRDWKQRESLYRALEEEVKRFDEPVVTFLWMRNWDHAPAEALWDFVQAHPEGFNGCHRAFYGNLDRYLGGSLTPFVRNDREYVLWTLEKYEVLEKELAGSYPGQPILEYVQIKERPWPEAERDKERQAYESLIRRYAGKAAALYPKAELLRLYMQEAERKQAPEERYRELRTGAVEIAAQRKAFKGREALLAEGCTYPEALVRQLESSFVNVAADGKDILVFLRNLPGAEVRLLDGGKELQRWSLQNPSGRFYVVDTLRIPLPVLPDGSYTVEAKQGKLSGETRYEQYSLSIATRTDAGGPAVYVADHDTGIPLQQATLRLLKGDREAARTTMKLDAFTRLPSAFAAVLDGSGRYTLEAQSGTRKSRPVSVQRREIRPDAGEQLRGNFYRDRGAYQPGDTVKFKLLVYRGNPSQAFQTVAGRRVSVHLRDSENKIVETLQGTTNEWGSVAGAFVLPSGLRNGFFALEAADIGSDWFRVDEFVLPSFDLGFDAQEGLCLVGDTVAVCGRLVSYSGHPMSGMKLSARVTRYGVPVLEETVTAGPDQAFCFRFPATEAGYYQVTLTATDPGGETRSFGTGRYVSDALSVQLTLENKADAELEFVSGEEDDDDEWEDIPAYAVENGRLQLRLQACDGSGRPVPLPVRYRLLDAAGGVVSAGESVSGETFALPLPGSGAYRLVTTVSARKSDGTTVQAERVFRVLSLPDAAQDLPAQLRRGFLSGPSAVAAGEAVRARLGISGSDAYAVVTLFGGERQLLHTEMRRIPAGRVETLAFPYRDDWPDAVNLQVFYFLHGGAVTYNRTFRREKGRSSLPLHFTRFRDKALPGAKYTFSLATDPGAEVLVAAWDKSIDAVSRNDWPLTRLRETAAESAYIASACGSIGSHAPVMYLTRSLSFSGSAAPVMLQANKAMADDAVAESAAVTEEAGGEAFVRTDFAPSLCFLPQLRPSADGSLSFEVETSDRLSTFYVRACAHDKQLRNALAEGEMQVSLPLKVSLLEPRFLYDGDVYDVAVTLSSTADEAISGVLVFRCGTQEEQQVPLTLPAGETLSRSFRVTAAGGDPLELTALFRSDACSDGVRVTVPVYPAAQTLTEAHSAVLHAGEDREALLEELRGRFVNLPGASASLQEISVLDLVHEAIPAHVEAAGDDVLSLSEAWYVRLAASRLGQPLPDDTETLLQRVLACRNGDGGFGWFEGMNSSPVMTAVLLERFARLREKGFAVPETAASVQYLDRMQLGEGRPAWCGGLSDAQYLYVRSYYPEVPMTAAPATEAGKKRLAQFRKDTKAFLTPSARDGRGLEGRILDKARRLLTLRRLSASSEGRALAAAWGIPLSVRIEKSQEADFASLLEYAVPHRDGGWYYPNAVLPWRGLLESEAYAHALLCELLSADAPAYADGIRLWLMLQKETQHWEAEPAFVDALSVILDASDAVLSTRVLVLSAHGALPFSDIAASGNGFDAERHLLREKDGAWQPLQEGEVLAVGERVRVEYVLWNAENRSFVKVEAGREASLQPVQPLSGPMGPAFLRTSLPGLLPQGYRNVKAQRTEYYFDVFPEEKTVLAEEFFVVRAGVFRAPAVTIESLYAPHYRANAAAPAPLCSE